MTSDDFVRALKLVVHDAAINGIMQTLQDPPGRRPPRSTVDLSSWYRSLNSEDQVMVRQVAQHSVHAAVFGLLSVLDGVLSIESAGEKGEIELIFRKGKEALRLNHNEDLHDLYQGLVWEEVFGE